MTNKEKQPPAETAAEKAFTKAQLMVSRRYAAQRDLLSALLKDGRTYTLAEVDRMIVNFRKGKVR